MSEPISIPHRRVRRRATPALVALACAAAGVAAVRTAPPAAAGPTACPQQTYRLASRPQPDMQVPNGIGVLPNDRIVVANGGSVIVLDRSAGWLYEVDNATASNSAADADADAATGVMFVAFTGTSPGPDNVLKRYQANAQPDLVLTRPSAAAPTFTRLTAVASGAAGAFAAVDAGAATNTGAIHVFSSAGVLVRTVSNTATTPSPAFTSVVDVALAADGALYAVDRGAGAVVVLDAAGARVRTISGSAFTPARPGWAPRRVSLGDGGAVWVAADDGVTRFDGTGAPVQEISNTSPLVNRPNPAFTVPQAVAARNGYVYVGAIDAGITAAGTALYRFGVDRANLIAELIGAPPAIAPGTSFTYRVRIGDNGPCDARAVVLTNWLPSGFTVTSATSDAAGAVIDTSGTGSWTVPALDISSPSRTLTVTGSFTSTGARTVTPTATSSSSSDALLVTPWTVAVGDLSTTSTTAAPTTTPPTTAPPTTAPPTTAPPTTAPPTTAPPTTAPPTTSTTTTTVADVDGDGLDAAHEALLGTDPLLADTDLDGVPDGTEAAQGSPAALARLVPLAPRRLLDTRQPGQGPRPAAGSVLCLPVASRAGLASFPAGASVVLNVTADGATDAGYVTVWPGGTARPDASVLNTRPGRTVAALSTVPVGADGCVSVYTSASVHLIVDLMGWYEPTPAARAGRVLTLAPQRLLDTRRAADGGALAADETRTVAVGGRGGVPATGVAAVLVNLTATEPSGAGYVTTWADGARPLTSSLNTSAAGETVANQVLVPLGADGAFRLAASAPMHVIVDVMGWVTDASAAPARIGLFGATSAPRRLLDTRAGAAPAPGAVRVEVVRARGGLPTDGLAAIVGTITGVDAAAGYLTAWPTGTARPGTSVLNLADDGDTRANAVALGVGADGSVSIYTDRGGHVLLDVTGYFVGR